MSSSSKAHTRKHISTRSKAVSVVVCYYDTKSGPASQPRQIARRCTAEIVSLCEQLGLINRQLSSALRQRDISDVVRLCQFHYENFLFRAYSVRERAWDVLAGLASVRRRPTGEGKFRDAVLSYIRLDHPELDKAFSKLQSLINPGMEFRNAATHETFLFLGIMFGEDIRNTYEVDGVLDWYDPDSKTGIETQRIVRQAIRKFVAEHKKHIQEISVAALDFAHQGQRAIRKIA